MKTIQVGLARQSILVAISLVVSASSIYGQALKSTADPTSEAAVVASETTSTETLQGPQRTNRPQTTANQTSPPPYVFPTQDERVKRFAKNTVGPIRLGRLAVSAGIDQWRDHPEEWGQGTKGYGKRFASGFGKNAIRQSVTFALDEAMDLDTSFQRSRRKGFWPRASDALLENVTSRNRDGKRVVSVPRFAGVYAGTIIPYETWYPDRFDYKDGLRNGTRSLMFGFGFNLVREFLIKW